MELTDVITIYSEKTPNPESMKFVANKMILPNDSIDFRTNEGLDTFNRRNNHIFREDS